VIGNWCPKHGTVDGTSAGCTRCALEQEYPLRQSCAICGWEGLASHGHFCQPKCRHVAPLELPPFYMMGGAILQLRQCRDCGLIGALMNSGAMVWMHGPELETKG
jgi:hypothetical protein